MKDVEIVLAFKNYLETERSYSKYTVLNYLNDIEDFQNFLKTNPLGTLKEVKANYSRYFLSFLHKKGYSSRTIARKMSSLRSLYKFMVREGIVDVNIFADVNSPKLSKLLPKLVYYQELDNLFDAIDVSTEVGNAIMQY